MYVAYLTDPLAKHTTRVHFEDSIGTLEYLTSYLRQSFPTFHIVARVARKTLAN